jgi:hypothetical protein
MSARPAFHEGTLSHSEDHLQIGSPGLVPLAIMVVLGLLTRGPQFAWKLAAGNMITRESSPQL